MRVEMRQLLPLCLAGCVAMSWMAAPAAAQDQGATTLAVAAEPAQTPSAPRVQTAAPAGDPYWSTIGGYETDSHETAYGFFGPQYIHPVARNFSLIAGANVNYLHYDFANSAGGHTDVHSPGVNTMGGVMFGRTNYLMLGAGPSFKRRNVETKNAADTLLSRDRDFKVGFNLSADASANPTAHNNVFGQYNYETVDQYHWGRVGFKEQVANRTWQGSWTPYLGAEYIAQGNQDIVSNQYGGFLELAHNPSHVSVMFRAGWKRSTFDFGPASTGPWFAVGFYHRM